MSADRPSEQLRERACTEMARLWVDLGEYANLAAESLLADPESLTSEEAIARARRVQSIGHLLKVWAVRMGRLDGDDWETLQVHLGDYRLTQDVAEHYRDSVTAWIESAEADRGSVSSLPGLPSHVVITHSRIPRDWRSAAGWLHEWALRRRSSNKTDAP